MINCEYIGIYESTLKAINEGVNRVPEGFVITGVSSTPDWLRLICSKEEEEFSILVDEYDEGYTLVIHHKTED